MCLCVCSLVHESKTEFICDNGLCPDIIQSAHLSLVIDTIIPFTQIGAKSTK